MRDESSVVVRRSSRGELLEIIKGDAISKGNRRLCNWVDFQLGVCSDFYESEIPDSKREVYIEESLCRTFGPLRESEPLLTEAPGKFIEFVYEAYTDAVRYSEFAGIEIKADSAFVSGGGTSKTYCFEAKFFEMLGLTHQIYETKLSFEYPHSHEEGKHNIGDYVNEQLGDLRAGLLEKLKDVEIVVEDKTLYISKKQVGETEQQ